jgi:hypothetical protein
MKKLLLSIAFAIFISFQIFAQIKEGRSYMIIASHSNKALEIKQSINITSPELILQQNDSTGNDNQLFFFKKVRGGYYQIIAKCSNLSLEVKNSSLKDHENIQQNKFLGQDNQLFTLVKTPNGSYAIINKNSGFGFDVLGGDKSFDNNVAVIQYPGSSHTNQLFRIVDFDKVQNTPSVDLTKHSFLYTGEWDYRKPVQNIFVVRDGKIAWSYGIPFNNEKGEMEELGDATMLANGNILFCRKVGASIVTPDKKIIWNIDAEKGCEIHSVQALGLEKVLIIQNGNPAKAMFINTKTNKIEKTIILPTGNPESSHMQFRRVRLTPDNTLLAAHSDNAKVAEYDLNGKEIWSYAIPNVWGATRLKNGNTLITSFPSNVTEVNKKGEIVWEFNEKYVTDFNCYLFQEANRLENGNTIICNWCPWHLKNSLDWSGTVQVIEVTPDKKVVWEVNEWSEPQDLGPASSIQILDGLKIEK